MQQLVRAQRKTPQRGREGRPCFAARPLRKCRRPLVRPSCRRRKLAERMDAVREEALFLRCGEEEEGVGGGARVESERDDLEADWRKRSVRTAACERGSEQGTERASGNRESTQ